MPLRSKRPAAVAALLALLTTVVLTGCLKVDMDVTLSGGTMSGTIVYAYDKRLYETLSMSKEDLLRPLTTRTQALGDAVSVEPYEDDQYVGVVYTLTNLPLEDWDDQEPSQDIRVVHNADAGTYVVTGVMDLRQATIPAAFRITPDSLDVRIAFTFPGRVLRHNGELEGTTVTWRPKVGARTVLEAEARDKAELPLPLIFGLAGLAAAVLALGAGLVIWLIMRQRLRAGALVATSDHWPNHT